MSTQGRDDAAPRSDPRDPELDRAWHAASAEMPPADVDARVLAAARTAVASASEQPEAAQIRRRWRGPTRWHSLLAAAAVAGLAFVLVPRTANLPTRELGKPTPQQRQDSSAGPSRSAELPDAAATAGDTSAERPAAGPPSGTEAVRAKRPAPVPLPARDDAPLRSEPIIPPPPAAAEGVAGESPRAVASPAPQASSRERRADSDGSTADAAAWAARIEALYTAGDATAAARELKSFRAAVPDAETYLSPSLRDWARTVP